MKAIAKKRTTPFQIWIKTQKKYRKTQRQLLARSESSNSAFDLHRKLDQLRRRLLDLNRKWKLGIATSVLSTWMAVLPPSELHAQQVFPPAVELSDLETGDGSPGFVLNGIDVGDRSGRSVSSAGDINGDGFDDVVIGASRRDAGGNDRAGESYVVFGKNTGFNANIDLSGLDGTNGFRVAGLNAEDQLGISVSSAGDINNDGIDDVVIGAYRADPNGNSNAGQAYVIFGRTSPFAATFDLASLASGMGSDGFIINGIYGGEYLGYSVSGGGDVNGDGFDDIILGAYGADADGYPLIGRSHVVFGASDIGSEGTMNLQMTTDGVNGFTLNGIDAFDESGKSVSIAGDINNDGFDDLIIGAYRADPDHIESAGESYVVFGRSTFPNLFELSSLAEGDGSTGFVMNGIQEEDRLGVSVSGAGDINGDGADDLIVGAYRAERNGQISVGEGYVVFGKTDPFSPIVELSSLSGSDGFIIKGISGSSNTGRSVSGAGDINGDGLDDLIIGSYRLDPDGKTDAGQSHVIFGKTSAFDATIELSDLGISDGFVINGTYEQDRSGIAVSNAGDVNQDGIDDMIIGAYRADPNGQGEAGKSYVVFGKQYPTGIAATVPVPNQEATEDALWSFTLPENTFFTFIGDETVASVSATLNGSPLPEWLSFDGTTFSGIPPQQNVGTSTIEVTATGTQGNEAATSFDITISDIDVLPELIQVSGLDGLNGFRVSGTEGRSRFGGAVSDVGDINGDGLDDIAIGAYSATANTLSSAGKTYVIFGSEMGFDPALDLTSLDGSNGFAINGSVTYGNMGRSVSAAGDVNQDGVDDLIIGAPFANNYDGEAYVIFGNNLGFTPTLDVSALDGTNGFTIKGSVGFGYLGRSVSAAGDLNGDGIDDVIMGAYYANDYSGETYVVFGKTISFDANLNASSLDGTNGFVIRSSVAGSYTGAALSDAGDMNGDGLSDVIIGSYANESYVVFGKNGGFTPLVELSDLDGTNGFLITGEVNVSFGRSVSGAGDVNEDGFDDVIIGASRATNYAGESYVIFGKNTEFPASLATADLDGTNGFMIIGENDFDGSGGAVSGAGDVNGDGINDLLIGAQDASPNGNGSGESYVVFGNGNGFSSSLNLSELDGTNGFVIAGIDDFDRLGGAVSGAGDVNNDGVDDIIIGALNANQVGRITTGESYVIFGIQAPVPPTLANAIADQQTNEDQAFTFVIPENTFADKNENDLQTLSAQLAGGDPLPAWLSFDPSTGTFSGAPVNDDVAILSIEVTTTDEDGFSVSDVFALEVVNVNDAPVLSAIGDQSGDEETEIAFTASATDIDLPTNTLTFSLDATSNDKGMTLDESTGEFSWTPSEDQGGDHEVTVTVSDGEVEVSETITITVNEGNQVPVLAAIGNQSGDELTEITFTASATDADLPANILTFSLDATSEEKGMVIDGASGAFSWTPTETQAGDHEVMITVSDGEAEVSETITITVNEGNQVPVLVAIGDQSGDEETEITFTASASDADLPANTLTFSLDATSEGKGMSIDGSTGIFSWTPTEAQSGDHEVTVSVNDGEAEVSETITITVNEVNQAPVLAAIGDQSGDEETEITFTASATDTDVPTNTLTFSLDATSTDKGMTLDESTGAFSWTPSEDQDGDHEVTITVSDGDLEDSEAITISVNEVNQAPVLAAIGDQSGDEETEITFTASATDADLPANTLTFSLDATSEGKGMTIDGRTGVFSWTPGEDQSGSHEVIVSVSDGDAEESETITISVNEVNQAPVLTAIGDQSGDELTEITFIASATDADIPANTLTFSLDATSEGKGMTLDASTGVFSWTPTEAQSGSHEVTITVSDGDLEDSEAITISINEVNQAPLLSAIGNRSGDEETEITFTASATDVDLPANTLMFSLDETSTDKGMVIDGASGAFSWTPTEAQGGSHDVMITVSDGEAEVSETISITVNEVNQGPVLAAIGDQDGDEETEITFTASATDADVPANTLTFSLDATSEGKGISIDGSTGVFSWTAGEDQDGDYEVTVTVSDGGLAASETIMITVNEVNQAPVLAAIGNQSGDEGTEITFTASATDADLPANTLTFSLDATSEGKGMTIDGSTGVFSWTPGEDQDGDHEVTVSVSDGEAAISETMTITVNEVNQAPVLAAISDQSGDEGTEITFTASATDADLPANTLTFSIDATSLEKGMVIDGASGLFSWTPETTNVGGNAVTILVSDGNTTDSETITITVNGIPLSVQETSERIYLYPNPATSEINLKGLTNAAMLHIHSIDGRLILESAITNEQVDISSLETGTYLIQAMDKEGSIIFQSRLLKIN